MSDFKELWIESSFLMLFFNITLNNMYNVFFVKKQSFFFILNIFFYFYFFSILNSNLVIKVNTIIDIVAMHYPDNYKKEYESLYINLNYKLNLRFFSKSLINKEYIIISIN